MTTIMYYFVYLALIAFLLEKVLSIRALLFDKQKQFMDKAIAEISQIATAYDLQPPIGTSVPWDVHEKKDKWFGWKRKVELQYIQAFDFGEPVDPTSRITSSWENKEKIHFPQGASIECVDVALICPKIPKSLAFADWKIRIAIGDKERKIKLIDCFRYKDESFHSLEKLVFDVTAIARNMRDEDKDQDLSLSIIPGAEPGFTDLEESLCVFGARVDGVVREGEQPQIRQHIPVRSVR